MGGSTQICPSCGEIYRITPESGNNHTNPFGLDKESNWICKKCRVKTKHLSEISTSEIEFIKKNRKS